MRGFLTLSKSVHRRVLGWSLEGGKTGDKEFQEEEPP